MDTQNALNRAYAHWLKDGLFEIGLGILIAGVGALRAIIHFAPVKSPAYYWLSGGLFVFMLGCGAGFDWLSKALKARITYPRIGYAAFKSPRFNLRNILAVLGLLVLGGILGTLVGILATQPDQEKAGASIPVLMGIVVGLAFALAARRVEVKRLYYLAAFSVGNGLILGSLGIGVVLGVSFFYLILGLVLLVSGSVTLLQFLHRHQPVDLNRERP